MSFSWITSRSKHSNETQESFKKFKIETILKIPGHIGFESVDIWFQDEAQFGQQSTTTSVWAKTETRPRVIKQQQFKYIFGAICPSRGIGEAIVVP